MTTPQDVLKEYLKGIELALESALSYTERKEIVRQRMMFKSSIHWIDHVIEFKQSSRNRKKLCSNTAEESKKYGTRN